MASQSELRKIGAEAFALIDKYYGPQRRNNVLRYGFEEPEAQIKRNDVVGGVAVVNNYTTKAKFHHQHRWGNRFHKS